MKSHATKSQKLNATTLSKMKQGLLILRGVVGMPSSPIENSTYLLLLLSLVESRSPVIVLGRPVSGERSPWGSTVPQRSTLPTLVSIDRAVVYGTLLRYAGNIQILCVFDMLISLLWIFVYPYRLIALHGIFPLLGIIGAQLQSHKLLWAFSFYLTAAVAFHAGIAISYNIWPLAFLIAMYIYLMYLTYKLLRLLGELTPLELAAIREAHLSLRRIRNG